MPNVDKGPIRTCYCKECVVKLAEINRLRIIIVNMWKQVSKLDLTMLDAPDDGITPESRECRDSLRAFRDAAKEKT